MTEGDVELIDGYEDLPEDLQAKVQRAIEQGHIDDEDWKGVSQAYFALCSSTNIPGCCYEPRRQQEVPCSESKEVPETQGCRRGEK